MGVHIAETCIVYSVASGAQGVVPQPHLRPLIRGHRHGRLTTDVWVLQLRDCGPAQVPMQACPVLR